jgi:hypothetical protein
MGWVEEKFQNDSDFKVFVPQLWDAMRDSIGIAISEFNAHSEDVSKKHLEAVDCSSMGSYCRRVTKGYGPSLEIFLQEKKRTLMIKQDGSTFKSICGYRIKRDRSGAEFFYEPTGDSMDVEVACRAALEIFIFGAAYNLQSE